MDPPQLSEAQALVLLQQHCGVFRRRLVFDASRERGAHVKQKWMALLCLNVTPSDLCAGLGYELRVAIDVVNALCACRGFAPHRNNRFWRDAVASLWIEYSWHPKGKCQPKHPGSQKHVFQPPPNYMLSFDSTAFSCFTVEMETYPPTRFDASLVELWQQIAWVDAAAKCPSALLQSRREVLTQLQRYAVQGSRTLKLELKLPDNVNFLHCYYSETDLPAIWDWRPLYAAVQACDAIITHGAGPTNTPLASSVLTPQKISLAIQHNRESRRWLFALFTTNLRQVRQLVSCSSIQCLTLDVAFQENTEHTTASQNQLVWFGELLHVLLIERPSLRTLRLEGQRHDHLVAAACSLMPMVSCLQELAVFDVNNVDDACWLAYALRHPLRTTMLSRLALQFDRHVEPHSNAVAVAVWASETPLKSVAQKAVATAAVSLRRGRVDADQLEWFASGTTMALVCKPTAELFGSPAFALRVWKPVSHGTRLEVVVVVASMDAVGVVARGWELCWIHARAVCVEQTAPAAAGRRGLLCIEQLSLTGAPLGFPVPFVGRILDASALVSLRLHVWGPVDTDNDRLASLLECCPNLECLGLEYCTLVSLVPLVEAYESRVRPCRIASLSLAFFPNTDRELDDRELPRLLSVLAEPTHPAARVLRHLSVTLRTSHRELVQQVARVLAVNHTLETVFVCGSEREDAVQLNTWTKRILSPFQDQVLLDATACCIGLLSVIREYSNRGDVVGAMDALVVKTVMAFVGPTRIRTVRWLCGLDTCFPSLMMV